MQRTLNIAVGLPASGKSTLFKKLKKEDRSSEIIDCDYTLRRGSRFKNLEELLEDRVNDFNTVLYLDGLFLTKEDIKKVLDIAGTKGKKITHVVVHYFTPDIEASIWNDIGRRDEDSNITIKNAKIDSIKDIMTLRDEFSIKFKKQVYPVFRKPAWKIFSDKNHLHADADGFANGSSWTTGGNWKDCWGNSGSVMTSPAPEGMNELDNLLEEIAPSISFLQYKKIMNECVTVEESADSDYYGGCSYSNNYRLNVRCLYDYLVEKEFIEAYE